MICNDVSSAVHLYPFQLNLFIISFHLSFLGGCAEKSGSLQAGDELLSVNNTDVTKMSRIEAWGLMKRLPNGSVTLTVRHACINASDPTN